MRALVLQKPGQASIETFKEPVAAPGELLLKVRMVGFCGSDLNSFRGFNPLVSFPRVLGHEVSATIVQGNSDLLLGQMWRCLLIQAVEHAHHAGEDVRMPASLIKLSEYKGTVHSPNSS